MKKFWKQKAKKKKNYNENPIKMNAFCIKIVYVLAYVCVQMFMQYKNYINIF